MKRLSILLALTALTFLGSAPLASATAETVAEDLPPIVASTQTYTVPAVASPTAARDGWGVTEFDLIQFPIISSATSDCFGCRGGSHMGTDYVPGGGTPVVAIADGWVSQAGYNGCYGNSVTIEHVLDGRAVTSVYGHMQDDSLQVSAGQQVQVGQLLGSVGTTGCSTGNHLHLEIHVSGIPVDPEPWLASHVNWPER